MHTRQILIRIGVLVVLSALAASLVSAQPVARQAVQQPGATAEVQVTTAVAGFYQEPYHYMVKFVCGRQGDVALDASVRPGDYATAINIHNFTDYRVKVYRKPALHYTPYSAAPPPYAVTGIWVRPGRVLEIDCLDIYTLTGRTVGTFVKGMMHLSMQEELRVAAVYTVGAGEAVPSIDVEHFTAADYSPLGCGTNAGCAAGDYCSKKEGDCGGTGTCEERPAVCPDVWDPVCGCNGVSYGNACEAASAGVNVEHTGECEV